ncbi:hypothetical protein J6590_036536, partial [Homalodisca vitripennis]
MCKGSAQGLGRNFRSGGARQRHLRSAPCAILQEGPRPCPHCTVHQQDEEGRVDQQVPEYLFSLSSFFVDEE